MRILQGLVHVITNESNMGGVNVISMIVRAKLGGKNNYITLTEKKDTRI